MLLSGSKARSRTQRFRGGLTAGAGAADGNFERLVGIPIQLDTNPRIVFSRTHQTAAVAIRPLTQQFTERRGLRGLEYRSVIQTVKNGAIPSGLGYTSPPQPPGEPIETPTMGFSPACTGC